MNNHQHANKENVDFSEESSSENQRAYTQFVIQNILRGVIWLLAILGTYWLISTFLPMKWEGYLSQFSEQVFLIFTIFFTSETLFGIIPLEFFVLWAENQPDSMYVLYVLLLSILSYTGAAIAYGLGAWAKKSTILKRVKEWESFQYYASIYRRWGGIVIVISALTPLPFALISFLSATFGFPFLRYLLYSSTRFLRFVIIGVLLWLIY